MKATTTRWTRFKEAMPIICDHFNLKRGRIWGSMYDYCTLYKRGFFGGKICSLRYDGDHVYISCTRATKDLAEEIADFIDNQTNLGRVYEIVY